MGTDKPEVLAYIAGFLDGEGSIMLMNRRQRHKTKSWSCRVSIANTDRPILEWIQSLYGGSIGLAKSLNPLHKDCWHWRLDSKGAVEFLRLVRPYLRLKAMRADVVFEYASTITSVGRGGVTDEIEQARKKLHEKLVLLNARGRRTPPCPLPAEADTA